MVADLRLMEDKDGYPRPKGTCVLCLACVNICPTRAMQMWLFTEYGNQYEPRWKRFTTAKVVGGAG